MKFGRRRSDARTLVAQTVLMVEQSAFRFRSPDMFGSAGYHVRVFRPTVERPILIVGDLGNHPAASVTNRFDEVGAIVTESLFGIPGVAAEALREVGRWILYYPDGAFGPSMMEDFTETWFEQGRSPQHPVLRSNHLSRDEVEESVGGPVRAWRARQYHPDRLAARGITVRRITA
ncbi:hypothetical protein [Mangrovihabitans endophyticus]|uniref:hypothetical protein n=1 Tax=Mangrovihabitans endophyticus TaxID=1751298 RepID=UPI00166C94F5|nr:hypothetical protein [Mangrovihabitans endophyticus]